MIILRLLITFLCLCFIHSSRAQESYEPNNDMDTATWFVVNDDPQAHKFDYQGDEDWFVFFAIRGLPIDINIDGDSVGEGINPAIDVYNEDGVLEFSHDFKYTGQGELASWSFVPATGFYFVRVYNVEPEFSTESNYTFTVFIPFAPQNGTIKGKVTDQCTRKGINKASIKGHWLSGDLITAYNINDGFSRKGNYGLTLDPGQYRVEVNADNYQQKTKDASVSEFSSTSLSFELTPEQGCSQIPPIIDNDDEPPKPLDQLISESAGIFDETTLMLELKEVRVLGDILSARLQLTENSQLQLLSTAKVSQAALVNPAFYDFQSFNVDIPQVYVFGQFYSLKLTRINENWLFDITELKELDVND